MDIEAYREYCLSKPGVTESLPFGPDALVFKVMGKMFALVALDLPALRVSLKNKPEKNISLREAYHGIEGAYHMNKQHWSSVDLSQNVPISLLLELTEDSYKLVVEGLSNKVQSELKVLIERS